MGDGVLHDQSLDAIGMLQSHAKTDGAAIVLHVERVAREGERFAEVIHDLGIVIERVCECFRVRPVAVSEARVIGSDEVIAIGKPGEEWLEHARRRGQSVEQENWGRIYSASLSVENR